MMIIKDWFLQKTDIEQKIVLALVSLSFLLIIYAFLYLPISRENKRLNVQNSVFSDEIIEMQQLEKRSKSFSNRPVSEKKLERSEVMQLMQDEAKKEGIKLTINQQGQDKLSVKLLKVEFNAVMRWVERLKYTHYLNISYFSAEAKNKGLSNIKIVVDL